MALVSRPASARVRLTYLGNLNSLTINGINPAVNAFQLQQFVNSLNFIQTAPVLDGFLTREVDLVEE